jgi:hypothetical protein
MRFNAEEKDWGASVGGVDEKEGESKFSDEHSRMSKN